MICFCKTRKFYVVVCGKVLLIVLSETIFEQNSIIFMVLFQHPKKVLTVYKLNAINISLFMHKTSSNDAPLALVLARKHPISILLLVKNITLKTQNLIERLSQKTSHME